MRNTKLDNAVISTVSSIAINAIAYNYSEIRIEDDVDLTFQVLEDCFDHYALGDTVTRRLAKNEIKRLINGYTNDPKMVGLVIDYVETNVNCDALFADIYFEANVAEMPLKQGTLQERVADYSQACELANKYVDSLRNEGLSDEVALEDAYYEYLHKING